MASTDRTLVPRCNCKLDCVWIIFQGWWKCTIAAECGDISPMETLATLTPETNINHSLVLTALRRCSNQN